MITDLNKLPVILKREFLDRLFDAMLENKTVDAMIEGVIALVGEYEGKVEADKDPDRPFPVVLGIKVNE